MYIYIYNIPLLGNHRPFFDSIPTFQVAPGDGEQAQQVCLPPIDTTGATRVVASWRRGVVASGNDNK